MRPFLSRLALLGLLAVGAMGGGVVTSSAQSCAPGSTDCPMQTQDQRWANRGWSGHRDNWRDDRVDRRWDRHERRVDRRWDRRDHRWDRNHYRPRVRSGIYLNFGADPYYDGYRYRPSYVEPRYRVTRLSQAHIEWCYARYRTYRLSDNTYKPTVHTRRQCVSPYL